VGLQLLYCFGLKIFNFLLAKSESVNTCTHLSQSLFCGRVREWIRGLSEISVFLVFVLMNSLELELEETCAGNSGNSS
jgi:hypothetical protein